MKKAFSLVEVIIMLTVTSVIIAASTPIITRKIVNNAEGGASLGGGTHGRYEFYYREFLDFGGKDVYSPIPNTNSNPLVVSPKVIVYDKVIDDSTQTVYEELKNITPVREKDGTYSKTEAVGPDKNNPSKQVTYRKSKKYVFEDGTITFQLKTGGVIDENKRIIEGNLAERNGVNNGYTRWKVTKKNPNVYPLPWEKFYSGKKLVYDREAKSNKMQYTPPPDVEEIVIHAVGGGGAGGGPSQDSTTSSYVEGYGGSPIPADELRKMMNSLMSKVPEFKGRVPNCSAAECNYGSQKDGPYIRLTNKGELSVTIDIRKDKGPWIFPKDILKYPDNVGSADQTSSTLNMPDWFNWQILQQSGIQTGAVACAGHGGKAGNITWNTNNATSDYIGCMGGVFGPSGFGNIIQSCTATATCSGSHDWTTTKRVCHTVMEEHCVNTGYLYVEGHTDCFVVPVESCHNETEYHSCACSTTTYCKWRGCTVTYNTAYVKCSLPNSNWTAIGGCAGWCGSCGGDPGGSDASCGSMSCERTSTIYAHHYIGGEGGNAPNPPCVYISQPISEPITITHSCQYNGSPGQNSTVGPGGGKHNASDGEQGRTCHINVNGQTASAIGGEGGHICYGWASDSGWLCRAIPIDNCGKSGSDGTTQGGIQIFSWTGVPEGIGRNDYISGGTINEGIYNERFTWSIPFAMKRLGYGESGSPGNYATTKIPNSKGTLEIELGRGGDWGNSNEWKKGKRGPDGEDTIVSVIENNKSSRVLVAQGGKGGTSALSTDKFNICYEGDKNQYCKDANGNTKLCCADEKSTQEVRSTSIKLSDFDKLKSFAQNSMLIGIGMGRGGEGAGNDGGMQFLLGERKVVVSSSGSKQVAGEKRLTNIPLPETKGSVTDASLNNKFYAPPAYKFKGGDGAVLLVW